MNSLQKELLGSWHAEIATPTQGGPGLLTFTADGSVIGDESPLPGESTAHGTWVSRGPGEVAYTMVALMGTEEGKNAGKLKVAGTLQFDADTASWRGPFKIEVFDAGGRVTLADRGTINLTRIAVEALD